MPRGLPAIALVLLVLPGARAHAMPRCALSIEDEGSIRAFTAEIAASASARQQGLMYRTALAADAGMLFVLPQTEHSAMWMKNTLIPLDMLFFDGEGRLVHVERRAEPQSLRHRAAAVPVRFILEVNGGAAEGLEPGTGAHLDLGRLAECPGLAGGSVD